MDIRTSKIEVFLPALASTRCADTFFDEQLFDRAREITGLIRDLTRCEAFSLTAWDPVAETHLHRTVASDGYSTTTLAHINDEFIVENQAFAIAHCRDPRSLRWRDYRKDWKFDFPVTRCAQEYLVPSGFREGATMCLRLPDGRYTGAFHMSWNSPAAATDARREITERFRPILSEICDKLRAPRLLAETIPPHACAMIVSPGGLTFRLPDREPGPHLGEKGALRQFLLDRPQATARQRFLWPDDEGGCHRVTITPCSGNILLVSEEPVAWPYRLSLRELEILHLVSEGHSNPEIAERLFISARTVSTHVEHILAKMGCSSRTRLAAVAVAEGLLLPNVPFRNPLRKAIRSDLPSLRS